MNGEEVAVFVKEIAEAHSDNPAAANATYYLLLDKYAHLFDLEGLDVIKKAQLALDEFLALKSNVISPDDDLSTIPF